MSHFNENEDTTKNDSGETKTQYKKFTWKKKTNQKKATSKLAKCSWAIKWTHHHYLMLSSIFFLLLRKNVCYNYQKDIFISTTAMKTEKSHEYLYQGMACSSRRKYINWGNAVMVIDVFHYAHFHRCGIRRNGNNSSNTTAKEEQQQKIEQLLLFLLLFWPTMIMQLKLGKRKRWMPCDESRTAYKRMF